MILHCVVFNITYSVHQLFQYLLIFRCEPFHSGNCHNTVDSFDRYQQENLYLIIKLN